MGRQKRAMQKGRWRPGQAACRHARTIDGAVQAYMQGGNTDDDADGRVVPYIPTSGTPTTTLAKTGDAGEKNLKLVNRKHHICRRHRNEKPIKRIPKSAKLSKRSQK